MYRSNSFGRIFWIDINNDFRSCPLKLDNTGDFEYVDYVSDRLDGSVRPFFSGMTV